MTNEEKRTIIELREKGLAYSKIALQVNIASSTIKSFFQKYDKGSGASVCLECGKAIPVIPHRKKKKFCCDVCRFAWWSKHRDARQLKAIYNYVCPTCRKEFTAYGNPHRVYCSRACSAEGRRERYGKGNV